MFAIILENTDACINTTNMKDHDFNTTPRNIEIAKQRLSPRIEDHPTRLAWGLHYVLLSM